MFASRVVLIGHMSGREREREREISNTKQVQCFFPKIFYLHFLFQANMAICQDSIKTQLVFRQGS